VGGRTGSGKTVFLLDMLYGLTARYSPDELALYLLDFKEGVSFTEFIPTDRDPTWVPHARAVGVESDREYGLAVLTELVREMSRRAAAMKQAGVTNLAQLRLSRRDIALPRILTVIDEFHVLLQGNDETAKKAVTLLEEVARKGRSYGIHLILASQSISGIEALYTKSQSVFGQFGMRVALAGGGGILDGLNQAADSLPIGQVILNHAAGVESGNRRARFPDADVHSIHMLRHRMWQMRTPGSSAPAMFIGYAEYTVGDYMALVGPWTTGGFNDLPLGKRNAA
jgi:ribosomal protein L29